jgi:hypothetical protein
MFTHPLVDAAKGFISLLHTKLDWVKSSVKPMKKGGPVFL